MPFRLSLDDNECNGNGLCALESPGLFEVDDDTGLGRVLIEAPEDDMRPQAVAAAKVCPVAAIVLDEEN